LGKLKEKMVVSKADLEAEQQRKETKKQEFLARAAKRRAEVETEQDGGFKGEANVIGKFSMTLLSLRQRVNIG